MDFRSGIFVGVLLAQFGCKSAIKTNGSLLNARSNMAGCSSIEEMLEDKDWASTLKKEDFNGGSRVYLECENDFKESKTQDPHDKIFTFVAKIVKARINGNFKVETLVQRLQRGRIKSNWTPFGNSKEVTAVKGVASHLDSDGKTELFVYLDVKNELQTVTVVF